MLIVINLIVIDAVAVADILLPVCLFGVGVLGVVIVFAAVFSWLYVLSRQFMLVLAVFQ